MAACSGTGMPGGTWGLCETINGVTYDRTGAVLPRSGVLAPGNQTNDYNANEALAASARIDLGFANAGNLTIFNNPDNYSLRKLGNGDDITIRGGEINGNPTTCPDGGPWNGGWHDHAAIFNARGRRKLFELGCIRNRGDGICFGKASPNAMNASDDWTIRRYAILKGGDDCIENDWKDAGTVYECFLSGVCMISTRPGSGQAPEGVNTSGKVVRMERNLLWLRARGFSDLAPHGGSAGDSLVFSFFKWQTATPANGMQCHLIDNVLRYGGSPVYDSQANNVWGSLPTSGANQRLTVCQGNVLLQPNATSGFPIGWPTNDPIVANGFTYLYDAAAKARWNDEVNAWAAAHPEVGIVTADKGLFP